MRSSFRLHRAAVHGRLQTGRVTRRNLLVVKGLQSVPPQPVGVTQNEGSDTPDDNFLAQLEAANLLDERNEERPYPMACLALPVYSLSTNAAAMGGKSSMNLMTYVSETSLSPRTITIGLFRGTQTWTNFLDTRTGILQVLRQKHIPLCQILGKTSARDTDKIQALNEADAKLATFFGHSVLSDCFGLLELEMVSGPHTMGDHDVVVCEVGTHMTNRCCADDVLTTNHLREAEIMPPIHL